MEESKTIDLDFQVLHENYRAIKKLQKVEKNKENYEMEELQEVDRLINESTIKIDGLSAATDDQLMKKRLLSMKVTLAYERSKFPPSPGVKSVEETFAQCLEDIREDSSAPEMIYLSLRVVNHYAYLLSKREDYEKSRSVLELGDGIYRKAKTAAASIPFFTSENLFSPSVTLPVESSNKLERLVTSNLQMLAFVYSKLELHDKFAEYHHEVLERQLEMVDNDLLTWSFKAMTLAQYLLGKNRFSEARHHLAAATHVLYEQEKELKVTEASETISERWQELQKKFADVASVWVKYGLTLFNVSKTKAMESLCHCANEALERVWVSPLESGNSIDNSANVLSGENPVSVDEKILQPSLEEGEDDAGKTGLFFRTLNLVDYESQVSDCLVESSGEARALFHHTHAWLKKVKLYYTLQNHPMMYVNTILELSELYKHLAFYEEDIEGQYAVQKLRADALETLSTVLREIRPQCYFVVTVEILRELAEIQLEMVGLNLRRIYASEEIDQTLTSEKINALSDLHSKLQQFSASIYSASGYYDFSQ